MHLSIHLSLSLSSSILFVDALFISCSFSHLRTSLSLSTYVIARAQKVLSSSTKGHPKTSFSLFQILNEQQPSFFKMTRVKPAYADTLASLTACPRRGTCGQRLLVVLDIDSQEGTAIYWVKYWSGDIILSFTFKMFVLWWNHTCLEHKQNFTIPIIFCLLDGSTFLIV